MPDREPVVYGEMSSPTQLGGASYREHADLKERVTRLEASLGHLPAEVARLSRGNEQVVAALHELQRMVEQLTRAPAPQDPVMAQVALALHALADAQRKPVEEKRLTLTPYNVAMVAAGLILLGVMLGGQVIGVGHIIGAGN